MGFLTRLMGLLGSTYYFVGSLSVASPAAGLLMLLHSRLPFRGVGAFLLDLCTLYLIFSIGNIHT